MVLSLLRLALYLFFIALIGRLVPDVDLTATAVMRRE